MHTGAILWKEATLLIMNTFSVQIAILKQLPSAFGSLNGAVTGELNVLGKTTLLWEDILSVSVHRKIMNAR